jgi:hypothetical protein
MHLSFNKIDLSFTTIDLILDNKAGNNITMTEIKASITLTSTNVRGSPSL